MTSGTVPFKEGTVPCLQPQGGFLREQEGFCTLQKQPGENSSWEWCHRSHAVAGTEGNVLHC